MENNSSKKIAIVQLIMHCSDYINASTIGPNTKTGMKLRIPTMRIIPNNQITKRGYKFAMYPRNVALVYEPLKTPASWMVKKATAYRPINMAIPNA